jgi:hypothetical protein
MVVKLERANFVAEKEPIQSGGGREKKKKKKKKKRGAEKRETKFRAYLREGILSKASIEDSIGNLIAMKQLEITIQIVFNACDRGKNRIAIPRREVRGGTNAILSG